MHFLSQFLFVFCLMYSVESVILFVDSVFIISNENSFLEIMKSGELVFGF